MKETRQYNPSRAHEDSPGGARTATAVYRKERRFDSRLLKTNESCASGQEDSREAWYFQSQGISELWSLDIKQSQMIDRCQKLVFQFMDENWNLWLINQLKLEQIIWKGKRSLSQKCHSALGERNFETEGAKLSLPWELRENHAIHYLLFSWSSVSRKWPATLATYFSENCLSWLCLSVGIPPYSSPVYLVLCWNWISFLWTRAIAAMRTLSGPFPLLVYLWFSSSHPMRSCGSVLTVRMYKE